MARRIIQQPQEIIMFQGDNATVQIKVVDNSEAEAPVNITLATALFLKAWEFLDSAVPLFTLVGIVGDGPGGVMNFTFVPSNTSGLAAKTYIYTTGLTLDTNPIIANKNQLTIRNKFD